MSRMTEPLDLERDEVVAGVGVSAVLVAGLTLVHLGMAYSISTLPDFIYDLVEPLAGDSKARLVVDVFPSLPLALVVLGVGLTVLRGSFACAVVVAAALLAHAASSLWLSGALLVLGAAAAWGIARRHGWWWVAGLVVAPLVAQLFRWLDLDTFSDNPDLRASFLAFVLHVVPAVAAGLVCWALEWWQERR
jgi:hypothetical protein